MRRNVGRDAFLTGQCVQAQPAHSSCGAFLLNLPTSKNLEALIYGRQIRLAPAAAGACRLSLPGGSKCVPAAPASDFRRTPEIRRPWPLQSMAANGRRQNPRQQVRAGLACPAAASACRLSPPARSSCGALSPGLSNTKNLEALIYGRQIRVAPAATGACRLSLPGGSKCVPAAPASDFRRTPEIRRPWPLQSMAANGRRQNPRQQVPAGSACPAGKVPFRMRFVRFGS